MQSKDTAIKKLQKLSIFIQFVCDLLKNSFELTTKENLGTYYRKP